MVVEIRKLAPLNMRHNDESTDLLFCRCSSPPDKLQSHPQPPEHSGAGGGGRRDRSSNQTPMLRALIELEETRSTQSRAPCK